ncbi:ABC transporter permease [Candidatus Poribacteria bacterium]|nr:ABC transporter permease [Candidatus Poribacteria bacterium]
MLMTLIQKEMMHHILSARFVALLLMCVLLIPLNLHINYHHYLQRQIDYQEQETLEDENVFKDENSAEPEGISVKFKLATDTNFEVSKLILKPTPLSVFATGLESALPSYLGMTRNGITRGEASLSTAPIAFLLGHLDYVFVVSTVFSLLALLFTFDAVAGEREAGTLRITLANSLPRDIFLWSKLIGGYFVFILPFLISVIIGLLVLVLQGFPLSESDIFLRILCLIFVSLLYIAVFFALGAVISIYFDSSKTALIVAFTIWVFVVLILPRVGFLAAQIVAPTSTAESVYREKTARRAELRAGLDAERGKMMSEVLSEQMKSNPSQGGTAVFTIGPEQHKKMNEKMAPLEEEARVKYRDLAAQLDRRYQRERKHQDTIGVNFSRITPTASFIFLATDATQTGQAKKNTYFQIGTRYYERLDTEMFSKMSEDALSHNMEEIPSTMPPPPLVEPTLGETLQHAALDLLLLCFFAIVLTTVAFLKFFRMDI